VQLLRTGFVDGLVHFPLCSFSYLFNSLLLGTRTFLSGQDIVLEPLRTFSSTFISRGKTRSQVRFAPNGQPLLSLYKFSGLRFPTSPERVEGRWATPCFHPYSGPHGVSAVSSNSSSGLFPHSFLPSSVLNGFAAGKTGATSIRS